MSTFYTYNHLYFLRPLSILDSFNKNLLIPTKGLLTPQKRRSGFKNRVPTP